MEEMEFDPVWLVFLLLMVGDGGSARWILLLQKISGETSCFKSSVRLGRVLLLTCEWISSLGLASFRPVGVGVAAATTKRELCLWYWVCGWWWSNLLVFSRAGRRRWVRDPGMHGDDPRPTCHKGQGLVVYGGRFIRLSKQLDCDGVALDSGCFRPALSRRRIEVAADGDDVHEDFVRPSFVFFSSGVLCTFVLEQCFPLFLGQLCLCLYLYSFFFL
ncbi:unnamed protein product [Urochloa humidicola]